MTLLLFAFTLYLLVGAGVAVYVAIRYGDGLADYLSIAALVPLAWPLVFLEATR